MRRYGRRNAARSRLFRQALQTTQADALSATGRFWHLSDVVLALRDPEIPTYPAKRFDTTKTQLRHWLQPVFIPYII